MLMHNDDAIMIKQRVIISRFSLIFNLLDQRPSLFMSERETGGGWQEQPHF